MNDLTSIAGIIILTTTIVQGLKTWCSSTPVLNRLPMIFIAVLVACGVAYLSFLAGFQSGSVSALIAKAALAAFGSNGLYSMMSGSSLQPLSKVGDNPEKSNRISNDNYCGIIIALLLTTTAMGSGCGHDPMLKYYKAKSVYVDLIEPMGREPLRSKITDKQRDTILKPAFTTADQAFVTWKAAVNMKLDTLPSEQKVAAIIGLLQQFLELIK